jgi:monoamine oxidase
VLKLRGPVILSFDASPADGSFGVLGAFHRIGSTPADPRAARAAVAQVMAEAMRDPRYHQALDFHLHDWGQDAYSLTCTPPMPPGLLTSGLMPTLALSMGAVVWAGTECGDRFALFMEGAVRSGHQAAAAVLQRLAGARVIA